MTKSEEMNEQKESKKPDVGIFDDAAKTPNDESVLAGFCAAYNKARSSPIHDNDVEEALADEGGTEEAGEWARAERATTSERKQQPCIMHVAPMTL